MHDDVTIKDKPKNDYNARKRKYSAEQSNDDVEEKRACYGDAANISEEIVSGFMHSFYHKEKNISGQSDIIEHLVFECTWVSRKRKHYMQALTAVLTTVNDLHNVSLPNVARNLSESWLLHRDFYWDQFIVMFSIAGSFYKKRPDLYLNIRQMLMYYCAFNHDGVEFLGGYRSMLNYTNLNLAPDSY